MPRPPMTWCPTLPREGAEPATQRPFEVHLRHAYLLGLGAAEAPLGSLASRAPEVLRQLRRRCEQHGVGVSTIRLEAALGVADGDQAARAVGAVLGALEVARLLGASGVTLTVGPEPGDLGEAEVAERVVGELERAAEAARRRGLVLAIENRWTAGRGRPAPMPWTTFEELLAALAGQGVRGHLSTRAALQAGEDPAQVVRELATLPWQVRLGDLAEGKTVRGALGDGLLDLDGVLAALAGRGYTGLLGLEAVDGAEAETEWRSLHRLRQGVARWWDGG